MLRLISALVLLPIVLGVIWFTPPLGTWILGAVVLVLAFLEYAALARQLSPAIPTAAAPRSSTPRAVPSPKALRPRRWTRNASASCSTPAVSPILIC